MMSRIVTVAIGTALALAATIGDAGAQAFPNRPVQLMVAYPAGGSTDIAARIVAAIASKRRNASSAVIVSPL